MFILWYMAVLLINILSVKLLFMYRRIFLQMSIINSAFMLRLHSFAIGLLNYIYFRYIFVKTCKKLFKCV